MNGQDKSIESENVENNFINVENNRTETIGKINMMTRELRKLDSHEEFRLNGNSSIDIMSISEVEFRNQQIMQKLNH